MAKPIVFTARTLESLKPKPKLYDVREDGGASEDGQKQRGSGLRLRVFPSGRKSFRWAYTGGTKTLGNFGKGLPEEPGTITLAQAHAQLAALKEKARHGIAPDAHEDLGGAVVERPRTVEQLCAVFYEQSIKLRRKRPEEALATLNQKIVPVIGRLPLIAVDTVTARQPVVREVQAGHAVRAGTVLQVLKQLFNFAAANGYMDRNPAAPLRADDLGVVRNKADRHLSADEIPSVLHALDERLARLDASIALLEQNPKARQRHAAKCPEGESERELGAKLYAEKATKLGIKFLFFTGLRTLEALTLEWRDVDFDAATVTVRPENQKLTLKQARAAKPFVQPLNAQALAILKHLRALADKAPSPTRWVFYSHGKEDGHLGDKALGRAMRRLWSPERKHGQTVPEPVLKIPRASPHNFRDTMATHMSDTLGLPPHVPQLCLGHSINGLLRSGVAAKYDHASRIDERRAALEAYATWVEGLMTGQSAEVVPMRAHA